PSAAPPERPAAGEEVTPLDIYRRLMVAAATRKLPDDLADQLAAALDEFREARGRKSLCACLGLRGNGVSTIQALTALEQRNAALLAALAHAHGGDPQASRWRRIGNLCDAIRRYQRSGRVAPAPLTALQGKLQRQIERAAATGLSLPSNPTHLWKILRESPAFSCK
ncbi:MAG: hypothetical protein L0H73_12120, partial [Nitrococcus sp.]|nr:hypothetical protein [Nitrococcus sp.]